MWGSGLGASGRSKSSAPCSSRKVTSSAGAVRSPARRRVSPDQVCASLTDAGPKARQVAHDQAPPAMSRSEGASPSHASTLVCAARPLLPQTPRGGTCTSGTQARMAWPSAKASRPGNRFSSSLASSLKVRGRSSTSTLAAAATSSRSSPSRRRPNWPLTLRSITG